MTPITIFWFRRDLRLHDNTGLFHALQSGHPVLPIFIFDTEILDKLSDKSDARLTFIHDTVTKLQSEIRKTGSDLDVRYGNPKEIWSKLAENYIIKEVYSNHDYESYSVNRDKAVQEILFKKNITFKTFKDHVIFEKDEIIKDDDSPYTVFTPYKKKWLAKMLEKSETPEESYFLNPLPSLSFLSNLLKTVVLNPMPSIDAIGFVRSAIAIPPASVPPTVIIDYDKNRDFPALQGTSRLGVHLRFGTVSIRDIGMQALKLNQTYLSELIWRDFYNMILFHFPYVEKGAFRREYDQIDWLNDETNFKAWCHGMTGYPMVDAGMRQLAATGFMHNRVRMVTASFLTKHLLIDWKWGEAWFASKLLDYDLASNNGGWQWAAGCGTDAAPYFRIFSPEAQMEKFDKEKKYIKKWVPEFGTDSYPKPIVDHRLARERCLKVFKAGLSHAKPLI